MLVRTFLNDGPGRFWRYEPGDRLYEGPVVSLAEDPGVADSHREYAALDRVWAIGNRMVPAAVHFGDVALGGWPSYVRSLSAGDVLVIGENAWAVDSMGFRLVGADDLAVSLGPDAKEDPRGGFGPPAKSRAEAGLS